ncbi:hypothetical protein SAMN06273572_101318 [Monaibacterium marinum]|uniref:Uncharacterized protein n=1 Tax=Pontivivens marinum TaxID=1690039 RepID=A0A2C9CLT7_9RHOB|nr:hypothetical protein [Monaibacterium marinum]SOH92471.1 hypothetical protein SAMN06273572_101318 [Monaibacterium marinum]
MFHDRFDGVLMSVFISIEFAVMFGASAWVVGDLAGLSMPMHWVALAFAAALTTALLRPIWRRMLAPASGR